MTPTRARGKPVFDPTAIDEDLDELWPTPNPAPQKTTSKTQRRTGSAPAPATISTPTAPPAPATARPAAVPRAVSTDHTRAQPTSTAPRGERKRTRPPEVLLSAEVYDEFYRVQIAEKKVRRGLARTMGTIVLDAIEAHAGQLATTWTAQQYAVGEGQLFERPSSNAVPRRRRHATAPRTVVLSGVTAANGERLDDLVETWGAGTRSALVEQALRYEFGLLPT